MTLLVQSIIEPELAIVLGGTWRVPVMEELLSKNFVQELKLDGTFNEASFDREYESKWGGDAENSFFNSDTFDKHRVLNQPEYERTGRLGRNGYYVFGIDVGRTDCTTEVCVIKVLPQPQGSFLKSIVNFYSWEAEHFGLQSINIKKLYYKFLPREIGIDANGNGIGLVDFLTTDQVDPDTGDLLPNMGVGDGTFDGWKQQYKDRKTKDTVSDILFLIKANAPINTECHAYVNTQLSSGKIKLLIDEGVAKSKLLDTKRGQEMSAEKRAEYLKPFVLTSVLKEQMANLIQDNDGVNIILKQAERKIPKDRFSAFEYGLYTVKRHEDKRKRNGTRDISKLMFFG